MRLDGKVVRHTNFKLGKGIEWTLDNKASVKNALARQNNHQHRYDTDTDLLV